VWDSTALDSEARQLHVVRQSPFGGGAVVTDGKFMRRINAQASYIEESPFSWCLHETDFEAIWSIVQNVESITCVFSIALLGAIPARLTIIKSLESTTNWQEAEKVSNCGLTSTDIFSIKHAR
jgi:hypothetical protein